LLQISPLVAKSQTGVQTGMVTQVPVLVSQTCEAVQPVQVFAVGIALHDPLYGSQYSVPSVLQAVEQVFASSQVNPVGLQILVPVQAGIQVAFLQDGPPPPHATAMVSDRPKTTPRTIRFIFD